MPRRKIHSNSNGNEDACVKPEGFTGRQVIDLLEKSGLEIREEDYVSLVSKKLDGNPFAFLIAIIISQNTTDKAAIRAYKRLHSLARGKIVPEKMVSLGPELIEFALHPAGLARQKSDSIYNISRKLIELGGEKVLSESDPKKLREILKSLPGIGDKTIDVYLSQMRGENVFAVDTHARRIAHRWCLTKSRSYRVISQVLTDFFKGEDLVKAHKLLIALGRKWCKAKKPRCEECPLREICPYAAQRLSYTTRQARSTGQNKK